MKKSIRLVAAIAALAMTAGISACGSSTNGNQAKSDVTAQDEIGRASCRERVYVLV